MSLPGRALARDRRAATIVEFAIVAPVMLFLCLNLSELAFQAYTQSVLTGAVEKAGRDGTIEDNVSSTAKLDQIVEDQMKVLVPAAVFKFDRKNYDDYASMAGEPFVDSKYPDPTTGTYDGICNHGESFTDLNGNGKRDPKLDESGQGGANDVTLYTAQVTYNRIFSLGGDLGLIDPKVTLSASTMLKGQPFANQNKNTGTTSGTCP